MGTPLQSTNQITVDAVEAREFSSTNEGKGGGLSRDSDDFRILGCKRHFNDQLPSERLRYQRRALCQFIEAVVKKN